MSDGVTGRELWTSDGTAAGTASLDLAPGAAASDPQELTPLAGRVLFTATTPATGRELFVTDGTPAGTRLVADLTPGTGSSSLGRLSSREDGVAWFLLVAGGGSELWRTDGTEAGTRRVEILNPDARYAQDRAAWIGDWLLVPRHDGITGQEPWRSDGDTPGMRLLFDIEPGILSSAPRRITPSGTRAWFTIERGTTSELWTSDGEAETVQLTLLPGRGSVAGLTAGGATVFHAAADGEPFFVASLAGGSPPGVTDVPGVRVEGVDPGGTEGRKVEFVAGRFVFAGFEESAGVELWTLSADGDCDGAADASDVCPWVADPGQEDSDADGVGDACDVASDDADGDGVTVTEDCDDADAATWRAPEEVRGVRVSMSAGVVTVSWDDARPRSGPAVRAEILGDALGRWDRAAPFATASCLLRDLPGTAAELDRTGSWWAIVRARVSGCGAGPAGAAGLDAVSCP